jgi:DNA replication protein DnaC
MKEEYHPIAWLSRPSIHRQSMVPTTGVETTPALSEVRQEWLKKPFHLMLSGPAGSGKTHAAVELLEEYAKTSTSEYLGSYLGYLSMVNLEDMLDEALREYRRIDSALEGMKWRSIVVLDDFGTERKTEFMEKAIWRILEERFDKPTVITTNLSRQEILVKYGTRISSRLQAFKNVKFTGPDLRR